MNVSEAKPSTTTFATGTLIKVVESYSGTKSATQSYVLLVKDPQSWPTIQSQHGGRGRRIQACAREAGSESSWVRPLPERILLEKRSDRNLNHGLTCP